MYCVQKWRSSGKSGEGLVKYFRCKDLSACGHHMPWKMKSASFYIQPLESIISILIILTLLVLVYLYKNVVMLQLLIFTNSLHECVQQ